MEEIWKPIPGYEGLYEVSSLGEVVSLPKMRGAFKQDRKTVAAENCNGYLRVRLHKDGKSKKYFVHRLVAMAFMPTGNDSLQIDHIDGNKQNNRLDNLRWCTAKENSNFPLAFTARSRAKKKTWSDPAFKDKMRSTSCCKRVGQFDLEGNLVATYRSCAEAKRVLGYYVNSQCRGVYKSHYKDRNYTFKYI